MNEDRYRRISEIFHEAVDLEGKARQAFLDQACRGDAELRREVESLLAHDHDGRDAFNDARGSIGHELLAKAVGDTETAGPARDGTASPLPLPETIGRYRILQKIGEGGMGAIYLAEQDHPRRRVALKMIRPNVLSPSLLRRFQQEEDLLGRLQHRGIAQIYEAGEIDTDAGRQPYFAMEFIEGAELRKYAKEHELGVRARLELVARVCDAVHHAHQKGIIHRDLKPGNILVVEESTPTAVGAGAEFAQLGQPKVLDFGVARATDSDVQVTTMQTDVGQLIGTLPYMSPEQVVGDSRQLDTRSDIYALGVILYELLSGRVPYDLSQKSIPEAARMIREEEPTRLSSINAVFRGDIDTIVGKALEKDRERRYQSAGELAADIRRYLASEPIAAHPPSTFYQLKKFARRHAGLVAGLVLSFVILLAGTVTSLTFGIRAVREGELAKQNEQLAKVNEERALLGETAARRAAYQLSITAADAVGDMDPLQALRQLQDAPPEYRGWEWRHLLARIQSHSAVYTGDQFTEWASTIACHGNTGIPGLVAALERNRAIDLIDLESGDVWAVFSEAGGLTIPTLSPDGSRLAAVASAQEKLIVWDIASAERLLELPISSIGPPYTRFSPDGALIGLISREEGLTVRETATGRVRFQTPAYPGYHHIIEFDAEGLRVAVVEPSSAGHFGLKVVSATGEHLASQNFMDGCASLAFSPDGSRLAIGQHQRKTLILDASTLSVLDVLYGHAGSITALAYSTDGAYLASSSKDGTTRIWDPSDGEPLRVLVGGDATSLAFAQGNTVLAAGSSSEARRWAWTYDAHFVLRGHKRYVYIVTFSPDPGAPGLIASSSWDNTVRLWDPLTGEALGVLEATRCYRALSFTPDGARLVAFDESEPSSLVAWDTATGLRLAAPRTASDQALFEILQPGDPDYGARCFRVAAGGAKSVYGLGEDSALSRDRSLVAMGSDRGDICITDSATGRTIKHVGMHEGRTLAVAFSPDAERVVSGGEDRTVRVWDLGSGAELATMNGHDGQVYSVNYSPDGTRIVSGGNDETIRLWDAETFDQVAVLRGHESYVHSVCFSPDGTMLASGSGDGTVCIWDSVPMAERWHQIQAASKLRRDAEPLVDRLLAELGDPLDVADHIRADDTLKDDLRRAARYVLLKRSMADRRAQP